MRQFAVFGLGIFGSSIAIALYQQGFTVLGVDIEEDPVKEMAGKITEVVQADTTDEKVLEALGVKNFDVAIVSIGNDIQSSVLTTLAVKELGVPFIVARAINEMHGKILEKIGADRVIFPERDMALRVAKTLAFPNAIRTEELFPGYNIVEVRLPVLLHGVSLGKAQLRNRYGITVLAIRRENEYRVSPSADEVLLKGDIIYVLGNEQQLRRFFKEMVESRNGKVVEV
ncbi:potassium channel family protein [Candidatus Caldatribacterium sp. SIUC1]|uniref:potassium channel family protein n=1 Tax=Candidatus Caldatribacterium sp. SIUC1 TaxID=3418365 RepID=UPI003F68DD3A